MARDLTKLNFDSAENYLKRDSITGSDTITLPSYGNNTSYTVNHNLGYVPQFNVFMDISNDGVIWAGHKVEEYTDTSLSGINYDFPQFSYWATTTTLVIYVDNTTSPTATGTRPIYWVIYKDYGS